MIHLRDVRVSYRDTTVLDLPALDLPEGRLTAIVGPNGAGKSTLFSVISRLLPPQSGTVRVGDLDVRSSSGEQVARRLAVMRQDNHVTAKLTVVDLVRLGRWPHSHGRLGESDHAAVRSALEHADLTAFADRYLEQLSGGQRQRAFLAMALAQDTPYVLLDEPLNNLDIKHSVQTMRLLRRLVEEFGKTVALVLHDINFAAAHADHIVALRDGELVAAGPPEQVVTPEVLRRVYDVDVRVLDDRGSPVAVYFA